jgi:hypothetical protein
VSNWALVCVVYSGAMLVASGVARVGVGRRVLCAAAAGLYAAVAWVASGWPSIAVQLAGPGALLLVGYWLPSLIVGPPQAWLEARLLRLDRRAFATLEVHRCLGRSPRLALEVLEGAYLSVYAVVGGAAIVAAFAGVRSASWPCSSRPRPSSAATTTASTS